MSPLFLEHGNSVKKTTNFNNFDTQHSEETGHQKNINVPTSPRNSYHITVGNTKSDFQLNSTVISIKQLHFQSFL